MTTEPTAPPEPTDTATVIDEELATLPTTYRLPLVLCAIQGLNRREAARELGIAEGTLSSRLARGRKLLRERLQRRGVVPAVVGLTATVPPGLASATVGNAMRVLTHAVGAVPAGILSLTEGVMKTMIVKWKLAAVLVAACIGLMGFGAWRDSTTPVAAASPPATTPQFAAKPPGEQNPPPLAQKPSNSSWTYAVVLPTKSVQTGNYFTVYDFAGFVPDPVATIFGDVPVSREAFADHLIRRYGKKELELFVNKQILAQAFGKKGWTIKAEDVFASLDSDCKALGVTREQFTKEILPRYGKTLDVWMEDVITPRLMISQLCKAKMPAVTEAELRQAFKVKYGEKLKCRAIYWKKDEEKEARKMYEKVRNNEDAFAACAQRQSNPNLAATRGIIPPIPRTPSPDADAATLAVAKLKVGEISPLIATADGFIVVKCDEVIPADKTRSFEAEKLLLLSEVSEARINREIPKLFDELKREANPKYHLTFPDPVVLPNPPVSKP